MLRDPFLIVCFSVIGLGLLILAVLLLWAWWTGIIGKGLPVEGLTRQLKDACTNYDLPLLCDNILPLENIVGIFSYQAHEGHYISSNKIMIAKKYLDMPWVLAHELGHYLAISKCNDDSEEAADREGRRLVEKYLGKIGSLRFKWMLDIHFEKAA